MLLLADAETGPELVRPLVGDQFVARQNKTLLTNPLLVVFRNGYPFVYYLVFPFHRKFYATIFFSRGWLSVPRRSHDKGPRQTRATL